MMGMRNTINLTCQSHQEHQEQTSKDNSVQETILHNFGNLFFTPSLSHTYTSVFACVRAQFGSFCVSLTVEKVHLSIRTGTSSR
mmetsp:Transcript_66962/g.97957  ORF Transcript_66962/g.97957 Transcript_66962/m.97957 type:complete len:84 (-) Transcript_66962:326-577(-)